jgi:glutathione S-transferase
VSVISRIFSRSSGSPSTSASTPKRSGLDNVVGQIRNKPYLLGEDISAADILWGNALHCGMRFKLLPEDKAITDYVGRITQRPASAKVSAMDAELAAEHQKALG